MATPYLKVTVRQDGALSSLVLVNPVPAEDKLFESEASIRVYRGDIRVTRGTDAGTTVLAALTTHDGALEAFDSLVGEPVACLRATAQAEAHQLAQTNDRPYEHRVELTGIEPLALQLRVITELKAGIKQQALASGG